MLSTKNYGLKSWGETFPDGEVEFSTDIHESWKPLFKKLLSDKRMNEIRQTFKKLISSNTKIFPYPELVFNAFRKTSFDNINVVFIGQDPYPKMEKKIPQAMGLSFSVPEGLDIPSSLFNIYRNMMKFKQIKKYPDHGNLESWASQGCLMLNTALTVSEGSPNSHASMWQWFTDEIIKTISAEKNNIIFVLWGAPALKKMDLIDLAKHEVIISSHPSGLSCDKPLRTHPAFMKFDHFGKINEQLKKYNKKEINFVPQELTVSANAST